MDLKIDIEDFDYKVKEAPEAPEETERLLLSSDQYDKTMILLIESNLSGKTQRRLNAYNSTYIIQPDDNSRFIEKLPSVDIYIVDIRTCINWYMTNLKRFTDDKYVKIYYKKLGMVRDVNIPKLKLDYIRSYILKENAISKEDIFDKLTSNTFEDVEGCCLIFAKCLCSNITCANCIGYTTRCCWSFF